MPRFPKREAEIAALAEQLWRGLLDNNAIFSQPPVHPILIRIRKIIYQSRHDNFLAAQAAAEQATTLCPAAAFSYPHPDFTNLTHRRANIFCPISPQ